MTILAFIGFFWTTFIVALLSLWLILRR